ncbi:MAG TPA: DUF4175 family protein [Acidisoma sp.]|uniref:DUF4175 family protein n=1 Tax=Acidisoma sp. TaxID=1872115 RepID=UPI002D049AAC|nr:DUF4175 family protein [Acidisoma sp.]HTI02990.1 DUF4175 family protein [Acidisoma sp.]
MARDRGRDRGLTLPFSGRGGRAPGGPAPRGAGRRGPPLPRRLLRWQRAAQWVLAFEAIWPVLWPPLGLLALYVCAALLGLLQRAGPFATTLLCLLDLLGAAALLALGLMRLRWPDERAARARLRRASGLAHDPLATLEDTPAQHDHAALLLWRAHRARSLAATARLRLGLPWPWRARPRDLLFRGGIVAAVVACLWTAGPAAWLRLEEAYAIDPARLFGPPAPPPAVTAWITPPAYTGRPPILLHAQEAESRVPRGARLTVTVSGLAHSPRIDGVDGQFEQLDAGSFQLQTTLDHSGIVTLRGGGDALARWTLMVQPDGPPAIAFTGTPGTDADGHSLRISWHGADDYAVVSARMQARLVSHPEAPPLTLTLALPSGPAPSIDAVQVADLSANPWAGLPVQMQLVAQDAAGQSGTSPVETVTLPERPFQDPFAREVADIRKALVEMPSPLTPARRGAGAHAIFEVGAAALAGGKAEKTVLPLIAAGWQLAQDRDAGVLAPVEATLWDVALHFEQGDAADSAQSLAQAEAALKQALAGANPSASQLSRLMQQMQSAVLQHLSTLLQMAQRQGAAVGTPSGAPPLDLQRLAQQLKAMEDAAKAGDAQAMRQAMAALQKSLAALEQARVVKPDPRQQAARAQAEQDLQKLQSLMQQQAALMDRSTQRAEADSPDQAAQRKDAAGQAALRASLSGLAARRGAAIQAAGRAMGDAVQQLQVGQDAQAAHAQQQALLGLQRAANALGRQLSQQGQGGGLFQIGGESGPGQTGGLPSLGYQSGDQATDPLGRPFDSGQGSSIGADIALPEGAQQAQLRAILQELRDRAGDRSLSRPALDYIERLLRPF